MFVFGRIFHRSTPEEHARQCGSAADAYVGAGVHLRRVREPDGEDGDAGERADAERERGSGDESGGGAGL